MISTSFKVSTNRFNAFTEDLVRGLDDGEAQDVLEAVALKFVERVTAPPPMGTPIDTGRARAGWARALEGLGGSFERQGSDPKAISQGRRRGGLRRSVGRSKKNVGYVAITNNVEYIQFLEYGSSDQAPGGFIRIALEELRPEVREDASIGMRDMLQKANEAAKKAGLKWDIMKELPR